MASLRKAAQCIGKTGPFSLVHDFFGFRVGIPPGMTISLKRQIGLLKGRHIHMNVIRTAPFFPDNESRIDQAVQTARDTFAPGGVGIGRVEHFDLGAGGYEIIMDSGNAFDLWDSYSGPGDGLDAFFCYQINGDASGMAPDGGGSCDKTDKDSGIVIAVLDNLGLSLGWALAHEIGHYCELDHEDDLPNNLMAPAIPEGGVVGPMYGGQYGIMKTHCLMKPGCPN